MKPHTALISTFLIVLSVLWSKDGMAQQRSNEWLEAGLDIQAYPAGVMFLAKTQRTLSDHGSLHLRLGYNLARRQDFGKHSNEEGGGPGVSAGYRYYIPGQKFQGFFLEARSDIWFMTINWEDRVGGIPIRSGTTSIVVLQPTVAGGYQFLFENSPWALDVNLAFGIEWNIVTNGEEVGQGGISLIGIGISYRL